MKQDVLGGIDIGGTKCAVCLGRHVDDEIEIIGRRQFPTLPTPRRNIQQFMRLLEELMEAHNVASLRAIGISCGGPLDSHRGLILSPPNLPGWDRVDILTPFRERFGVPAAVENDANACALAEWRWGAGRGCQNMVFLTFGTGMGAGLILDGKLYSGTNDMAGEVGHVRLAPEGPVGYGKAGSFEGFCSGGGIARLAETRIVEARERGTGSVLLDLPAGEAVTTPPNGSGRLRSRVMTWPWRSGRSWHAIWARDWPSWSISSTPSALSSAASGCDSEPSWRTSPCRPCARRHWNAVSPSARFSPRVWASTWAIWQA